MNPWLFASLISFIIFLLLLDYKTLKQNIWSGILCFSYQLSIHLLADKLNYWHYYMVSFGLPNLIIFSNPINIFFLVITFNMGILFIQYLPQRPLLQLIHASLWTFFFRLSLYLAEQNNLISFTHWRAWMYYYLIPVNFLALAWINNILLEQRGIIPNENDDRFLIK